MRARGGRSPSTVSLEIEFFLVGLLGSNTDLDNLAKPVLDTLFAPRPNPNQDPFVAISGIVFDVDDSMVTLLTLRKTPVQKPEEQGATILASWVMEG